MPVLYHLFQLSKTQFGTGGILIEDWADDHNPSISYQTVETLAELLILTHIFRYEQREEELLQLLLEHDPQTPLVIIVYRRSGGATVHVQLRTDLLPPQVVVIDPTRPIDHHL